MKTRNLFLILLLAAFGVSHAQDLHWTWNPYQYGDNASFVAVINIDGVEQRSDQLELAAFVGDECRGNILCVYVPQKDRYFAYLTVNGTNGMVMTFRLWDHATQTEPDVTCDITYTFVPDDHHGLPSNPFVFPFTSNFTGSVFNGSVDNLWSNSGNWVGDVLPGANDDVLIRASCTVDIDTEVDNLTVGNGAVLTVATGKTLTVAGTLDNTTVTGLVVKDGAQLVNASANVAATAEKDIVAYGTNNPDGWYTLASPMDGMAIAGSAFLNPAYDLYRFNETSLNNEEWENYKANIADFTTFENGRGYLYANSNTFTPVFTGVLNHAAVSYGLTFTDRPDDELDGFNLVGNPFPHKIYKGAGGAIDDPGLASGYYTLSNEGAWHAHTYDEAIMPGQGILVKTTVATTLTIAKTTAAATAESSAKDTADRLKLEVTGDSGTDRAFVYFGQGIGLEKLDNFNGTVPRLYIHDGGDYAIAHVSPEVESLAVMFDNVTSGTFTLNVSTSLNSNFQILNLIDNLTGADIDLLLNPEYSFTATGEEPSDRFTLVFREVTGVDEAEEDTPFAFVNDGQLIVNGTGTLQVIDMHGRQLVSRQVNSAFCIPHSAFPAGVYMLRLTKDDQVKTTKIIIK